MKSINCALVTGGAGFIGSHIVDSLLDRGIETYVIDDLSTGNLNNLSKNKNNKLLQIKIGDISNIAQILKNVKDIDVVFHEAAIASVAKSVQDPKSVFKTNVSSSMEVLDFCVNTKVKKLIFASSSAVYGDVKANILHEDMVCNPTSPYGSSKLAVEKYLHSYWKTYGLECVSLRYFNVFGSRQSNNPYSGVITIFVNRILKNLSPIIFGDGLQTRDFINIDDIIKANILSMMSKNATGEVFNIGTGNGTTVIDLINILSRLMGNGKIKHEFFKSRIGDIQASISSIIKANKLMDFHPQVTIENGLKQFTEWSVNQSKNTSKQNQLIKNTKSFNK
ncbi:MAG: NAD-dependent epimerase/dehydratase family protein [Thermoproteota archaeon]|nr:NAD-dependent epimerase/dehydratase family protein [Thermoproteota archaeon]